MRNEISDEKEQLRNKIWELLQQKRVAIFPLPVFGRIPNFAGSDKAANLVRSLPEWKRAKVIFANPDYAQKKVREFALKEGKVLIMASPRLKHGFLQINPQNVKGKEEVASSIKGAFKYGKPVENSTKGGIEKLRIPPFDRLRVVSEVEPPQAGMPKPNLIITGCVAVDQKGWRLGKGGGYGDIEVKRIKDQFGEIPILTTIHPLQMVDFVPHLHHDTKVNIIVTPEKIYRIENLE